MACLDLGINPGYVLDVSAVRSGVIDPVASPLDRAGVCALGDLQNFGLDGARVEYRPPIRVVLEKPRPRTVRVEGPDGRPIAGARVSLLLLHVFGKVNAQVPASLATRTGPDGTATINYMAARDQLVAVRVSVESIGTQDIPLIARPGQDSEESAIAIKLKKTSRLAGRVVDLDGQAVANHLVQIWSWGDATWLGPNTVELRNGPGKTLAISYSGFS
jgi:hypothetical protein